MCQERRIAMRILVTAGPTRERIDCVRFITNRSSGKMGYALAEEAAKRGCQVTLVSGPVSLPCPQGVERFNVESAAEMYEKVLSLCEDAGMVIMAAAVADYRPKCVFDGKLKKKPGDMFIELERTSDILLELGRRKRNGQLLVGFAAESDNLLENAQEKLRKKNLDWIAANDIRSADRGFESDGNAVVMLGKNGERMEFPLAPKSEIAAGMLDLLLAGKPGR